MVSTQRWRTFAIAASLIILSGGIAAAIEFHQDFDSGHLDISKTEVIDAGSDRPVIQLAAREVRWDGRWFHFDVIGVEGKQPTFRVPIVGNAEGAHRANHRYMFSLDGGETFQYFNNAERTDDFFTFDADEPFPQETVRIAYSLPYPVARTAWHTRRVGESHWVTPTPSADANFVIAVTPGTAGGNYRDDLGREVPSLELLGYKITDPSVDDAEKLNVVFISGSHASESTAHWTLEGAVNFLISDDPRAAELRRNLIVYVYPQQNPEGRWAGYMRSSPEHPRLDQNRDWSDSPDNTTVRILQEAILNDTGGEASLFIDFHSHRFATFEIWDTQGGDQTPFFRTMSERRSDLVFHRSRFENRGSGWGRNTLKASFSVISETGFNAGWSPEDYWTLGRDHALAIHFILEDLRKTAATVTSEAR